jgi:UDP-N-acetylmuramoyl-tripeptide--D-alanyl-D-alanine ligase
MLMSFHEAASFCYGSAITPCGEGGREDFDSVCIDSREVTPGALFVALPGEKTDGHNFVEKAFAAGAVGALVACEKVAALADVAEKYRATLIAVLYTLEGLQNMAAGYLYKFPRLLRVGITGSSGKTTTKELTAAMLGVEKSVVCNEGNLNSGSGLPLAVFAVRENHEVGVFEMGVNYRGEMEELASILRPQIALITNIGLAHAGPLGGQKGIAREKKRIFSWFTGSQTAFIPKESEFADYLARDVRGKVQFYDFDTVPQWGGAENQGLDGWLVEWAGEKARFPLPGRHNLKNALAAAILAKAAGASDDAVRQGLASAKPLFGRDEIYTRELPAGGTITVVRDCYNANPDSMESALDFVDSLEWPGRRVYVLGSMLELGAKSQEAHAALADRLTRSKADAVFLFGEEMGEIGSGERTTMTPEPQTLNPRPYSFHTNKMPELQSALAHYLRDGDLVLLKGSRGCELERVESIFKGAKA